uniref:RNA-directed DNA polymerase n=1 Tax=Caenorhabditis japonica TaxID=281687 RepID=A0A8R1IXI0_CAEJA
MADLTKQISTLVATLSKLTQVRTSSEKLITKITKLADAISSRIPMFVYEPEDGRTFKSWYSRYKDTITENGSLFQGDVRTRSTDCHFVSNLQLLSQQVMDFMISGIEGAEASLDDIIILSGTVEEPDSRVIAVMQRIVDYEFGVWIEECKFLMKQIVFLDFVIDEHGRRPEPEKVADIQKMPALTNFSQLRSFLGLIQFYDAFVKKLFELLPPLSKLTKKDQEFIWSLKCQKAF